MDYTEAGQDDKKLYYNYPDQQRLDLLATKSNFYTKSIN